MDVERTQKERHNNIFLASCARKLGVRRTDIVCSKKIEKFGYQKSHLPRVLLAQGLTYPFLNRDQCWTFQREKVFIPSLVIYKRNVYDVITQLPHDVITTLYGCRFNVLTSQQRSYNVVLTSCVGWESYMPRAKVNIIVVIIIRENLSLSWANDVCDVFDFLIDLFAEKVDLKLRNALQNESFKHSKNQPGNNPYSYKTKFILFGHQKVA